MSKEILFDDKARQKLLEGVNIVAKAVCSTLGPSGRNVMLSNSRVTKDGVSVAADIDVSDPFVNKGVKTVIGAASKTNDAAGDGTTTSIALSSAIATEGMKLVAAGANPTEVKAGIDKAVDAIVEQLDKDSIKVNDKKSIAQVGTISANGDTEIGNMIAEAMEKVGPDGVITVEESNTAETVLDVVEGMQFGNGYLSPYFVTDQEKMSVTLENPLILMYEHKISSMQEILPCLEYASKIGRSVLVIAEDVDSEALAGLILNKLRGTIKAAAVKAPGSRRRKSSAPRRRSRLRRTPAPSSRATATRRRSRPMSSRSSSRWTPANRNTRRKSSPNVWHASQAAWPSSRSAQRRKWK